MVLTGTLNFRELLNDLLPHEGAKDDLFESGENVGSGSFWEANIRHLLGVLAAILVPCWFTYTWVAVRSLYTNLATIDAEDSMNRSKLFGLN